MRFTRLPLLAAISVLIALALLSPDETRATKRPKYGGTLRVQLLAPSISLDPREWKTGSLSESSNEKVAALVYDRLVALDDFGRFQPVLASEWSRDPAAKNWQFKLRAGVKFSDGSLLASSDVAKALQALLPLGMQVIVSEGSFTIRASRPTPDLLEQLASGRYFVFRAQSNGTLLGTGPFYVTESLPATTSEANPAATRQARIKLRANEDAWAGRPFLDAVEITLGSAPLRQLLDLQVGKADIVEIVPDSVRKARQENLRVWSSAPNTLLALRFDDAHAAGADERLREAMALAMDRAAMANVLLQRQADPTPALLPQWLSGYAFLFESPLNLERARAIRTSLPGNEASTAEPLRLRVDAVGDLMKLLGERVVLNARQANLTVQLVPHLPAGSVASSATSSAVGLHLFAWHYDSLSPRAELEALVKQMRLETSSEFQQGLSEPEQRYREERQLLVERRVVPLVVLPEYVGLSTSIRNWIPAPWGEWRLADVWLDQGEAVAAGADHGSPKNSATVRVPGVKP